MNFALFLVYIIFDNVLEQFKSILEVFIDHYNTSSSTFKKTNGSKQSVEKKKKIKSKKPNLEVVVLDTSSEEIAVPSSSPRNILGNPGSTPKNVTQLGKPGSTPRPRLNGVYGFEEDDDEEVKERPVFDICDSNPNTSLTSILHVDTPSGTSKTVQFGECTSSFYCRNTPPQKLSFSATEAMELEKELANDVELGPPLLPAVTTFRPLVASLRFIELSSSEVSKYTKGTVRCFILYCT